MSRHTRILAEKRINDAIFEIEMGEFQQHAEGREVPTTITSLMFQEILALFKDHLCVHSQTIM